MYNFEPSEYPEHHPQNHTIISDESGRIYLANNIGVLIFNGVNWERLNGLTSKALTLLESKDGRIFIGGEDEFGMIDLDSLGNEYYKSLISVLPDSVDKIGRINNIFSIDEQLLVITENKVLKLSQGKYISHSSQISYRGSFKYNNHLFINDRTYGLMIYEEGILKKVKGGGITKNQNKFLLTEDEIISFGAEVIITFKISEGEVLKVKEIKIPKRIGGGEIQCISVFNTNFLLGTKTEGLLIYSENWDLQKVINSKNSSIQDDYIKSIYIDKQDNVWLALDNGLSIIDINSSIYEFGKQENILGTINGITGNRKSIYLACTQGLLKLDIDSGSFFHDMEDLDGEGWDVKRIEVDQREFIFVANDNTIVSFENDESELVANAFPWYIEQSKNDEKRVWIGNDNGYFSLYWDGKKFVKEYENLDLSVQIRVIETDGKGNIWFGGRKGWLYHLKSSELNEESIKNPKIYDSISGLPSNSVYFFPYFIHNKLFIGTTRGIFTFNETNDAFEPSKEFISISNLQSRVLFRMMELPNDRVWIVSKEEGKESFENGIYDLSTNLWSYKPYMGLNRGVLYANYLNKEDEILYSGGSDDLYMIKLNHINSKYSYSALIDEIRFDPDSLLFGGHFFEGFSNNVYNYSRKPLRFSFGANSYKRKNDLRFKYFLQGFDETWTDWNEEAEAVYTNLPGGKYNMRVKAIDFFENESEEASFAFTILPPWYFTPWAYALYLIGFVGFVYGAIRVSTISLQRVIKDNTKEIVAQKDEIEAKNSVLEKQKGRIEKQNLNILDSIRYAKRIQMATLPAEDKIQKSVDNAWVMYRPKDIVSGDFYWLEKFKDDKDEKIMLAAVDCTGHGVPGAFMSIIGYNGLNRVVREYRLNKPSDILDRLNEIITTTLNQQGAQREEIKDGMDMSLCSFDRKNLKLEFAGAHNSVYIIRKGEEKLKVNGDDMPAAMKEKGHSLFEIKADKQPIGAFENRKNFNNHEIQLIKGDMIILFTDGYADQFGGPKGKKFFYKPFKRLLLSIADEHVEKQREIIEQTFNEWISYPDSSGDAHEQIDDICVLGVRV